MEEDECSNMLDHLQQYVPHLEKLISQLKDPKRKNRELQLNKLEGLHSMITDRKKKLKLDTLKKCEDVILKILQKVHPTAYQQIEQQSCYSNNMPYSMKLVCKDPPETLNNAVVSAENVLNSIRFTAARARLNEFSATPASPSPPPKDVVVTHTPIVIPTEKVNKSKIFYEADDFNQKTWDRSVDNKTHFDKLYADVYKTEKPDVYRKAGESLTSNTDKTFNFVRLGTKLDMSIPPLSSEDLEQLTISELPLEDTHNLKQLEDLREKIQRKLQYTEEQKVEYTDLRDKLIKNKASKEKSQKAITFNLSNKSKTPRVEVVFKDPDSKFGSLLSSIDQKILGEGSAKKKDKHIKELKSEKDRSNEKKDKSHKEKKLHKEDKKEPKSHPKKDKDEKQNLKDSTKHKIHTSDINNTNKEDKPKKESEKLSKPQEETKDKIGKSAKEDSKDKTEKVSKPPEDSKDKTEKSSKSQIDSKEKTEKPSKCQKESNNRIETVVQCSNEKPTNSEESGNKQDTTIYKRLADKYNPRPRKASNDTQVVENLQKPPSEQSGFPIPAIDNSTNFGMLREIINKVNNYKPSFNIPMKQSSPKPVPVPAPTQVPQMLPSPSGSASFTTNNHMVCSTEPGMSVPNKYNCPQQNLTNTQCGNTIVNAYILQNNVGNNSQFQNPVNNITNLYHNQIPQSQIFHPFEPIKNNEYDLSAMQPIDYYPTQYPPQNNSKPLPVPLLSPQSHYNNTNQIVSPSKYQKQPLLQTPLFSTSPQYNSYPQKERSPFMVRPKPETWSSDPRINSHSREENYRGISSRDPRIRNRKVKNQYVNNIRDNSRPSTPMTRTSFNEPVTKYDSFHSDYGNTSKDFISPLNSLYSAKDTSHITGKGYGVQKFKIPRKRNNKSAFKQHFGKKNIKLVEKATIKEKEDNVPITNDDESMYTVDSSDDISNESMVECINKKNDFDKKADFNKKIDINKNTDDDSDEVDVSKKTDVDKTVKIVDKTDSDENIHVDETINEDEEVVTDEKVDSGRKFNDCKKLDSDKEIDVEVDKKVEGVPKEESKEEKIETSPPSNESVFVGLISNLIQSSKNTELLNALLNTLTATASDEQKQKWLEKLISSTSNETPTTENESKFKKNNEDNVEESKIKNVSETVVSKSKKKTTARKLIRKRKYRKSMKKKKKLLRRKQLRNKFKSNSKQSLNDDTDEDDDDEENIIETVGERIKSRRRNIKNSTAPRLSRKSELSRRSELDMLHEDIKEMFIRDGVITATGKRLCRTVKNNSQTSVESNSNSSKTTRTRSSSAVESNKSILNSPKSHAKYSNATVIIERTDISKHLPFKILNKLESENKEKKITSQGRSYSEKRSLSPDAGSSKSKKTYVEEDSDNENSSKRSKIERETNKSSKDEEEKSEDLTITSEKDSSVKKGNKKRKRGHSWAAGVINKKVRKKLDLSASSSTTLLDNAQVIVLDDDDSNTKSSRSNIAESVKKDVNTHDINYYFDPQDKISCKLCQFRGKYIVQHYRSSHLRHEILISRISPDASKEAIEQSIENNYESVSAENIKNGKLLRKFTYKCRFCQTFYRNVLAEVFYDHVTSHTGEFRFFCKFCLYKTNGTKTLRAHLHSTHHKRYEDFGPLSASYPSCPNFNIIFGYICDECHFIQLSKKHIEDHAAKYHTKDTKVYKISMSTHIAEILENNVEQENEDNSTEKTKNEVPPEEPETEKRNPTVFKCDVAYSQENIDLDEQKHEKMKEISETVISKKKFGFDLLDKIKNRLNDKSVEITINESDDRLLTNENFTAKNYEGTNENDFDISKKKNEEDINEVEQKEVNILTEELLTPIDTDVENMLFTENRFRKLLNNKNCEPVLNTIERLQDMLNVPSEPPPLIPINKFRLENEIKTEDLVIQVGPITARKKNSYVLYMCYMESCLYSSINENEFESHCKLFHNNQKWDGICNICNKNTDTSNINDAFEHLLKIHKKELIDGSDKLKNLGGSSKISNSQEDDNLIMLSEESPLRIINIQSIAEKQDEKDEEAHNFPFMISSVTTLTPEEDEALTALQISEAQSSKLSSPPVSENLATYTSIPVTSPSYSFVFPVPAFLPLNNSPNANSGNSSTSNKLTNPKTTQKIWLKSLPLVNQEKSIPYKTELAEKCLLADKKLVHLYKCPHSNCIFSSDAKKEFNAHVKLHIDSNTSLEVPCIYCNVEIDFHRIAIHYEIKHGKSQYCCKYCFYRAMTQSYVEMHQEKQHPKEDRHIVKVPANPDSMLDYNQPYIPLFTKFFSKYICGQSGCEKKFNFGNDFLEHLTNDHKGVPLICYFCKLPINCSRRTITHMESHSIFHYHCGFCTFGGISLDVVYKHLAEMHYWLSPKIITRQLIRDDKGLVVNQKKNYDHNEIELSRCIQIITSEYLKYITENAVHEYMPQSTSITCNLSKNSNNTITLYKAPSSRKSGAKLQITETGGTPSNDNNNDDNVTNTIKRNITLNIGKVVEDMLNPIEVTNKIITSVIDEEEPMVDIDPGTDKLLVDIQDPLYLEQDNVQRTNTSVLEVGEMTYTESAKVQEFFDLTPEEVSFSVDNTTKQQNLTGLDLFSCSFCLAGFLTAQNFKNHIIKCVDFYKTDTARPFKCNHCVKTFKTSNGLLDHIRLHGIQRFACSICDFKHQHQLNVRSHMKIKHNITSVSITPVDPTKNNFDEDEFVVRPKVNRRKSKEDFGGSKDVTKGGSSSGNIKPEYGPKEVNALPLRPIFTQEIKCSECGYGTKVRANLVRHFQFHETGKELPVPSLAPVNLAPCLQKNEKMFDKMTNLALSSYNDIMRLTSKFEKKTENSRLSQEEEASLPSFVPSTKRYVCGVSDCNYLCLEESMLRCHLTTLHGDNECSYKCTHCLEKLSTDKGAINIEQIIKHLRLHDLHLYKCKYCKFIHNLKHKVDRHVIDKHTDEPPVVIVIRNMEHEPVNVYHQHEEIKENKAWYCGMCKYRCSTKMEISTHVFNKHDLDTQFKCALCKFKNNKKSLFTEHFKTNHPKQNVDVIDAYYYHVELVTQKSTSETKVSDTTPLWLQVKPVIRHIRGILLDDNKKVTKKSPVKSTSASTNLDRAIEAVASGTQTRNADLMPRKPKTLKEKMSLVQNDDNSDVIEIEDKICGSKKTESKVSTLDLLISSVTQGEERDPENLFVAVNVVESELHSLDLETLQNKELSGEYGPYGKPFNDYFLCPLCSTFKTKKGDQLTHHLYRELDYPRFVCTTCGSTGVSHEYLRRHSLKTHINLPVVIQPLSPDSTIETWVSTVLNVQTRIIEGTKYKKQEVNVPVPETSIIKIESIETLNDSPQSCSSELDNKTNIIKYQCQYCNYCSKSQSDLRKHEKRHWVQKPLKCGYCNIEGVTAYEISQHSKRSHPNDPVVVVAVPTPSTPIIKPLVKKGTYKRKKDDTNSNNDTPESDESESEPFNKDETVYICNYCPKRTSTISAIKSHWKQIHKSKQLTFKFYKILSSVSKDGVLHYKCAYCDYMGVMCEVKKHCGLNHPTHSFMFRHKCQYCQAYFRDEQEFQLHCSEIHPDKESIGVDDRSTTFTCNICDLEFDSFGKLLDHRKSAHPNVEVSGQKKFKCPQCGHITANYTAMRDHVRGHAKPYKCFYCPVRATYPSVIKSHHAKEHPEEEFKSQPVAEGIKMNEMLRKKIMVLDENGIYNAISVYRNNKKRKSTVTNPPKLKIIIPEIKVEPTELIDEKPIKMTARKSTAVRYSAHLPIKIKETARKSTTMSFIKPNLNIPEDGISHYGNKPDLDNVENVKTELSFQDSSVPVNVSKLYDIVNMFPLVSVVDYKKNETNDV